MSAVTIALSVQYLTHPEEVVAEIGRVLVPGGQCIVSFSNRMFPSKAIYGWRLRSDRQRLRLVADYFENCEAFHSPQLIDKTSLLHAASMVSQLLLGRQIAGDPFFAVIATKKSG